MRLGSVRGVPSGSITRSSPAAAGPKEVTDAATLATPRSRHRTFERHRSGMPRAASPRTLLGVLGGVKRYRVSAVWTLARTSVRRTIVTVAYDEELADRIRELLSGVPGLTEQRMFGGLAFLIGGNMSIAASGQGGVLVRIDPARSDALLDSTNASLMEMRGRRMQGWLRVAHEDVRTKRQLAKWVTLGASYARSLPAKR